MELQFNILFLAAFSVLRGTFSQSMTVTTYSSKSLETLMCSISSATEDALWAEVYSNGSIKANIFEYNGINVVPKSPSIDKYNNFGYDFEENTKFHLLIQNVEKDDGGTYICNQDPFTGVVSPTLVVEALPDSITIICSNVESCDEATEMRTSSLNCTCTASEVSPNSLQLEFSGAPSTNSTTKWEAAGDYFDLSKEVSVNPEENNDEITCSVSGYGSEGIEGTLNNTYRFVPPDCTLLIDCSSAMLTCNCRGQNPSEITYIFYDEKMESIATSVVNQIEVPTYIVHGKNNTFFCQGCNGIFYGKSSLVSNATYCPVTPSTEPPTTTDEKGDDKPTDGGASTAAIVGGVVGGCVVVGGGVIIIILIVKKSGNGEGGNNDNTDGNGVNSKLQSEPDQVEYAAVNKPKPDPQPAPRSSKPPGNNTEPEKMELQYADIDHSNRGRSNEIHQPADAPTEYATVQSVIV